MRQNPLSLAIILFLSLASVYAQGGGGRSGDAPAPKPKATPRIRLTPAMVRKTPATRSLAADLALMMKYFAGEFDNYFQVWEQQETKAAGDKFSHIHSVFAPVTAPAFGKHAFYVKQYSDGDPAKVYRQRLYSFGLNQLEKAIELKIYTPPDEKAFLNAHQNPLKLAGLTPEKMKYQPGCDVYWKREGENFKGYMKDGACKFFSQRSQKNIVITDDLLLTKDQIWINDQARDEQGGYIFGNRQNIPSKLRRVQWFTAWAAIRKENSEEYGPAFRYEIHDQGHIVPVPQPDGTASKYSVQLAQLVFQGASKTPVLKLGVIENATGKTVSYTWANPEAERIGINLRWLQTGLTLKK